MTSVPRTLSARHARVIRALSEHRRLSDAADAAAMSQPAFSRALHDAEGRLGHTLFQRGWAGSEPTTAGDIVIRQCHLILEDIDALAAARFGIDRAPRLSQRLRWRSLRAVAEVVRQGSVSGAASALNVTQPSVSQSLAEITTLLPRPLFKRRHKGMEATEDARALAALWTRIARRLDNIPRLLDETGDALTGRVSVGMLPFSGQSLVLETFGEISRQHPHVHLVGVPGGYDTLVEALQRGEIDLIIGVLRNPSPFPGLVEELLYHEEYMMIARADHAVHRRNVTMTDLAQERWTVAPHGTPIRRFFDRMFREAGSVPPAQSVEMFSFSNAEQMVMASGSIALLCYGKSGLANLPTGLRPLDLRPAGSRVAIGITRLDDQAVNPALGLFMTLLRARVRAAGET